VFDVIISANANNQLGCSRQFCELPQHDNLNKIIGRSLEFFAMQKIGMTKDRIIGRSLDVFWRKRGMTSLKNWRGGMVVLLSRLFCTSIEVALSGVEDF